MAWLLALLRLLFRRPVKTQGEAGERLLCGAHLGAMMVLRMLVDPKTGAILPSKLEDRRHAFRHLDACTLNLFLALNTRAHAIANLPAPRYKKSHLRQAELPTDDPCPRHLIRRARQILDQVSRFEALAQRRAERLKRHAGQKQTAHVSRLPAVIAAELIETRVTARSDMRPELAGLVPPPADARIRAPP